MAIAQRIKCLAGELKDPGLIPGQGEFFSLEFLLKAKMNQMVKKKNKDSNNSSNSLVFGRWLQKKIGVWTKWLIQFPVTEASLVQVISFWSSNLTLLTCFYSSVF